VLLIVNPNVEHGYLVKMLQNLAATHTEDPTNFFYVSSQNIKYSDTFEDIDEFPKLFILKTKRGKYIEYSGDFEEEKVENFIEMVVSGSGTYKKMKNDLNLNEYTYSQDL